MVDAGAIAATATAVDSLLENLKQLRIHHNDLISDITNHVNMLDLNLNLLKPFLVWASTRNQRAVFDQPQASHFLQLLSRAEDTLDDFVADAFNRRSSKFLARRNAIDGRDEVTDRIRYLVYEIKDFYHGIRDVVGEKTLLADLDDDDDDIRYKDQSLPLPPPPVVIRQDLLVGLENEVKQIKQYLEVESESESESKGVNVISIVGMGGLGKTTLARKIFNDPIVRYKFQTRIWTVVSQEFNPKDVYLSILKELTSVEDMLHKTQTELARLVNFHLQKRKFLIVLDDVWSSQVWDTLQHVLPTRDNTSRILITTRYAEVSTNTPSFQLQLEFMTPDDSWLLLQHTVFSNQKCPPEYEILGRSIARKCNGLPLSVVVIGGILAKKLSESDELSEQLNSWELVFTSMSTYLLEDDSMNPIQRIVALSYNDLPFHLRACFLYFGMFPEDFQIQASKLLHLWIAEGFIQPQQRNNNLEEIAENYLLDLVNRNLVIVDTRRTDGGIKTCRVHDLLHEFCRVEAERDRENLFKYSYESKQLIANLPECRRLCMHSHFLNFVKSNPYGPRIRSFCCFSKDEIHELPPENISSIPKAFKRLRILDATPIMFTRFPLDLTKLFHLKHVVLSSNFQVLPEALSNLRNLQLLIVHTTSRILKVKADIWQLIQLRHLQTNASIILINEGRGRKATNLQQFSNVSPESCSQDLFFTAFNLKKLGIRGPLSLLWDARGDARFTPFEYLARLEFLETLKLLNEVYPHPPLDGRLNHLPPCNFPPNLRKLTLSFTYLDWTNMSVLGMLTSLEVLKLKDNACVGQVWDTTDGGFRHLEALFIGYTDLELWEASGDQFPRLRRLELRTCEKLCQIPTGLADIRSFQHLELYRAQKAVASARRIYEQVQLTRGEGQMMLSIFPPGE